MPEHPGAVVASVAPVGVDLAVLPAINPGCPMCGREDALVVIAETTFCAACGYTTDSSRACT